MRESETGRPDSCSQRQLSTSANSTRKFTNAMHIISVYLCELEEHCAIGQSTFIESCVAYLNKGKERGAFFGCMTPGQVH